MGNNTEGQFGNDATTDRNTPVFATEAPSFTTHPKSCVINAGQNATLTIVAGGNNTGGGSSGGGGTPSLCWLATLLTLFALRLKPSATKKRA